MKGVNPLLDRRQLASKTARWDAPLQVRAGKNGQQRRAVIPAVEQEVSPGAAEWEGIGEPEGVGGLSTGEAGGRECLPIVAVVGRELAAGRSLELETAAGGAGGAAGGEGGAGFVTGALNGAEPLCPWRDLRTSQGC